jgi:hypothetical protein
VRIKPEPGETLRMQASDLRNWVAFMVGDCDQRRPLTIRPNHDLGRRPARANDTGIHKSATQQNPGRVAGKPGRQSAPSAGWGSVKSTVLDSR